MERFVQIKDTRIHIDCTGSGKTVVLLAGLGSFSPIIEFKPLVEKLKGDYQVITLEYAGYGQSDTMKTDRTIEHIAEEIHETLAQLGEKKYSMIAHSLAGIYGLYYVNRYKDEVTHFVGIDISVPQQFSNELAKQEIEGMRKAWEENLHDASARLAEETRREAADFLKSQTDYPYTQEELAYYADMAVKSIHERTVMDEIEHLGTNNEKVSRMKFPGECKTLLLVSGENTKRIPQWEEWHRELTEDSSCVQVVEGDHYLHLLRTGEVADAVKRFVD